MRLIAPNGKRVSASVAGAKLLLQRGYTDPNAPLEELPAAPPAGEAEGEEPGELRPRRRKKAEPAPPEWPEAA